jgi:hypothetical protein
MEEREKSKKLPKLQINLKKTIIISVLTLIIVFSVVMLIATNVIKITKVVLTTSPQTGPIITTTLPSEPPYKTEQQAGSEIGAPVVNPITGQQLGVKCRPDFCTERAYGSAGSKCPNSNETYWEQYCYRYPEYANSLLECDIKRTCHLLRCGVESGSC